MNNAPLWIIATALVVIMTILLLCLGSAAIWSVLAYLNWEVHQQQFPY